MKNKTPNNGETTRWINKVSHIGGLNRMEHKKFDHFIYKFRNIFSKKRTRITLYMVAVLWVAVAAQILVNRMFREEAQITEAFIKSETHEMQSSLAVLGEYGTGYLSEEEKENLIYTIADSIGLIVNEDITVWEEGTRSESFIFKQAKQATTEIKIVSVEKEDNNVKTLKHYIVVQLNILQGIESIDRYKNILEDKLTELGVEKKQVTLKYEGMKEGDLTVDQKKEIAKTLIDALQGEMAIEYDEGDLYTVYGYTGMLNEYVMSMGNKINVQIAITFNELTGKTKISLATPINNDSW